MSEENVESIYRAMEALSRWDIDGALAEADPEIEWIPNKDFPIGPGEIYRGHDELRRWYQEWFIEAWEESSVEAEDVVAAGDNCCVYTAHIQGRGKASGIEIDMRVHDVVLFRDGKWLKRTSYMDRSEALKAAGLSE